tara:strand:- start:923 stop:1132 length:210 start_codon:yes stop_codon:yes gene_type:complete
MTTDNQDIRLTGHNLKYVYDHILDQYHQSGEFDCSSGLINAVTIAVGSLKENDPNKCYPITEKDKDHWE